MCGNMVRILTSGVTTEHRNLLVLYRRFDQFERAVENTKGQEPSAHQKVGGRVTNRQFGVVSLDQGRLVRRRLGARELRKCLCQWDLQIRILWASNESDWLREQVRWWFCWEPHIGLLGRWQRGHIHLSWGNSCNMLCAQWPRRYRLTAQKLRRLVRLSYWSDCYLWDARKKSRMVWRGWGGCEDAMESSTVFKEVYAIPTIPLDDPPQLKPMSFWDIPFRQSSWH
jgi:hypothetical protein